MDATTKEKTQRAIKFSIYDAPIDNVKPSNKAGSEFIYNFIKSDKLKARISEVRAKSTKTERDLIKTKKLPYATFSGTFTQRADNNIITRSGLFCVDLDHIGNPEALESMKARILNSGYLPQLMFVSPSGDGLKVVYAVAIDHGEHIEFFTALESYFKIEFQTGIDSSCKDVSRPCFMSYDPEAYHNLSPDIIGREFLKKYGTLQAEPTTKNQSSEEFNDKDWSGEIEILRKWKVDQWSIKGWEFEDGKRNDFVSELCFAFNNAGIPQPEALEYLLTFAEEGFSESEIKTVVKRKYKDKAKHGSRPLTSTPENDFNTAYAELEQTPLFPVAGFPAFIQDLIKECARVNGTHPDFWAAAFFAATSAALGQSFIIEDKYKNSGLVWLAVVGASGVGKSEPLNFAFAPIHDIDNSAFINYKDLCKLYSDNTDKKKGPKPEQPKQYIIVDSTPEAMAKALNGNQKGITIVRDELNGWFKDFDKYNKSGEQQNMLSMWSQSPVKINRASGENLFIKEPFVNVFGGIQPKVLTEMSKDNRSVNGFLPRFCFVFPDKSEAPEYQNKSIDIKFRKEYQYYIEALLSLGSYRAGLSLDPGAVEQYAGFYNKNAALNNSGLQSDYLNEVNSKLNIIVLRTALILHLSHWASSNFDFCAEDPDRYISFETMKAAIEITEYFRATAKKVHTIISRKENDLDKKEIAKYLHSLGKGSQNDIAKVLGTTQPYINKILKE